VNISQTARRLVFCGTFTAEGLKVAVENGALRILNEGRSRKFVERVACISFSAARSRQIGQEVWYVTERAVFRLGAEGLELVEIAPGIDLRRDILERMAFRPKIGELTLMCGELFRN
jgi:propionate CoA-transferase